MIRRKKSLPVKSLLIAVATLALAIPAVAEHAYKTATLTQTIALTAQIDQSATLSCPGSVFFDVIDPSAITIGDKEVVCTSKVSLHKGGSASLTVDVTDLKGTESGGVISTDLVWGKTNLSGGYSPIGNGYGWAPLAYGPPAGATVGQNMGFTLGFELMPVANMVPDIYTGTATVTLYVL